MATATRYAPRAAPPRRRSGAGSALRALVGVLLVVGVLAGGAWVVLQKVIPPSSVVVVERCTAVLTGSTSAPEYDLAPDQAANAALIDAVAQRRGLPARATTIAIATAIQESKLRNLTYGDRDSLGLFQQRPSMGWGTAAQVQDPVYATNAFLSSMVKIADYETLPVGEVAQRVQRSGYPLAYNDHEAQGRAYASALSGYSPAALTCRLRPVDDSSAQAATASGFWPRTQALVDQAGVERGSVPSTPRDEGAAVRLGTPGTDEAAARTGWSLAAWSVAHADALGVVAVGTDGRQWRRDAPDDGWSALTGDDAASYAPRGAAVVVMAGGRLPKG